MYFTPLQRSAAGLFLALSLGMTHSAYAADVNGRIRGTVTDPQDAILPGVTVVATNQATGVNFKTKTQADGAYIFAQLPIGTYSISVTAPGFESFKATGITINIDQEYVEAVKLGIGKTSETLEVAADAVQVNTTDMQLSNIVNSRQMEELPLINRSFTALETTLPGVENTDTRFAGTYSVSGSQSQQSAYLINGADTNDITLNTIALTPNLDAIDQFNLIDGPMNAEYDRNSGAVVSASIKQGTNRFHGDAFEFYRDTFLNTNNFFQKTFDPTTGLRTDKVSPYHQNIFGGTIGGPVLHDKLFFFAAYQGTRQRTPEGNYTNVVYSAANLNGDFSGDLAASNPNAFSTNPIPSSITIPGCVAGQTWASCLSTVRGSSAAGVLPKSVFNGVSAGLLKYLPSANNGSTGYTFNATTTSPSNQYIGRVDLNINPQNQIAVIGIYQRGNTTNDIPFSGATVPGFGDGSISRIQQWTFDFIHQFSSIAVNDIAAHYTRFNFNSGAPQQVVQPSTAGFDISPQDTASATIPTLGVQGFFTLGGTNNGPQPRIDQAIQFDDNFSLTLGKHNLKFGYDGRRFNVSNTFDASNSGSYAFNNQGTYSTGDASLDFLLGIPASYSQGTGSIIQADAFLNYLYAQDTWKISNALTLNYGLGYQIDTPLRNHQYGGEAVACLIPGEQSTVFTGAPAGIVYPGDRGCFNSGQAYTRYAELGPRLGFAWAPDLGFISGAPGKFSVRGGFGIYYNRTEEESALQTLSTPPFGFTSGGAGDVGGSPSLTNPYLDINAASSEANRFPYVQPKPGQAIDFTQYLPIYNISSFDSSFRSPYSENFQVSAEREFAARIVTRVSYVGTLGRRNQVTYEGDPITQGGHDACLASTACSTTYRNTQQLHYPGHTLVGSPNIASVGEVGSYSSSNYNSLQVGITKGETHGLIFQLSYTYAHALDDASSFENSGFGGYSSGSSNFGARGYNQFNRALNYGSSTFDARHRLVFSPIYVVPVLHGHSTFSPVNLALAGWQISGIMSLATGEPFDISYAGSTSRSLYCAVQVNYYACPDIPLQTAPLARLDPRTRLTNGKTGWFKAGSFTAEPLGSFGNIGRNAYHGAGQNNTNLILAKNFNLSREGDLRMQLRMESDNVFNHTQFLNPNSTYGSSVFGQISGAVSGRQTQLGAKVYF